MGSSESNQDVQRVIDAYAAGFECGRLGATATNASVDHAATHLSAREWLRGYNEGRAAALPYSVRRAA